MTSADLVFPQALPLYCTVCTVARGILPSWALKVCACKDFWLTMATAVAERATPPNQTWEEPPGFWCTEELRKAVFVAHLLEVRELSAIAR